LTDAKPLNELLYFVDLTDNERKIVEALSDPEITTYDQAAKKANTTIRTVANATYRIRRKYEDRKKFVRSMDLIARRLGKKGRFLIG
jgi:hypothetical protein